MVAVDDATLAALQATLRPLEETEPLRTVVVIPSIDLDPHLLGELGPALPAYEERALHLLLLLARPGLRMVLVTSSEVDPATVDYWLALVPGEGAATARERLRTLHVGDASPTPLAAKLLARPELVDAVRDAIGDPALAFIAPFNVAGPERDLAIALGVPVYGPDARFYRYGTKSGGRGLFADEGVSHPRGVADVADLDGLVDALGGMRATDGALAAVVVKLNDSGYGQGNVIIGLPPELPAPGDPAEPAALRALLAAHLDDGYLLRLAADPGVVEELVRGEELVEPSVQMRILADGTDGVVCTHDQLMGGPNGQAFVGCRFPAGAPYAPAVVAEAAKVRARLESEGVAGRFGVDFVVVRRGTEWAPYAVEINLREGGTTHPFGALRLLTGGLTSADGTTYRCPGGCEHVYVASDEIVVPDAAGAAVPTLLDAVQRAGLHWDPVTHRGVVLHMLAALGPLGRIGATAIAGTREDAQQLFDRTREVLGTLARDHQEA